MNYFEKLNAIDVSGHIEKKGDFWYLSWAYAVEKLAQHHPDAIIKTKTNEHGFPAFYSPQGEAMVWVTVEINNVVRGQPYPVLDYRNKPITDPNVFDINTALQRALVKCIALHGLGLHIFHGLLAPEGQVFTSEEKKTYDTLLEGEPLEFWLYLQTLSDEKKLALHNSFEKGQITKKKKAAMELESRGSALFAELKEAMIERIESGDLEGLHEIKQELGEFGTKYAWKQLTPEQHHKARELTQ